MAEHNPAPWSNSNGYLFYGDDKTVHLRSGTYEWATDPGARYHDESLANAAFIVKAVNAHDELVAALTIVSKWPISQPNENLDAVNMAEIARAALAKATTP